MVTPDLPTPAEQCTRTGVFRFLPTPRTSLYEYLRSVDSSSRKPKIAG